MSVAFPDGYVTMFFTLLPVNITIDKVFPGYSQYTF